MSTVSRLRSEKSEKNKKGLHPSSDGLQPTSDGGLVTETYFY